MKKHRLPLFACFLAMSLVGTGESLAQEQAPQATTRASDAPASAAEAAVTAARSGNVAEMERLRGAEISLQGQTQSVLRDTKAYRDVLVVTGPDFKIAGGETGFQFILRIPRSLNPDELPPMIDASGSLTDFEPRPDGERLQWMPVVTIDFLK